MNTDRIAGEGSRHGAAIAETLLRKVGVRFTLTDFRAWASVTFSGERLQYRPARKLDGDEIERLETIEEAPGCIIPDIALLDGGYVEVLAVDE